MRGSSMLLHANRYGAFRLSVSTNDFTEIEKYFTGSQGSQLAG